VNDVTLGTWDRGRRLLHRRPPNQHPVLTSSSQHTGTLTVTLSSGLQAYDLAFG
jgi:hypothetical protein